MPGSALLPQGCDHSSRRSPVAARITQIAPQGIAGESALALKPHLQTQRRPSWPAMRRRIHGAAGDASGVWRCRRWRPMAHRFGRSTAWPGAP